MSPRYEIIAFLEQIIRLDACVPAAIQSATVCFPRVTFGLGFASGVRVLMWIASDPDGAVTVPTAVLNCGNPRDAVQCHQLRCV